MFKWIRSLFGSANNETDAGGNGAAGLPPIEKARKPDPGATEPLYDVAAGTTPKDLGAPRLVVSQAQSVGLMRDHNEDVLLTLTNSFGGDEGMPTFGLFVVADGMGGHSLGERASAIAARKIAEVITSEVYLPLLSDPDDVNQLPPLTEVVEKALMDANNAVFEALDDGGTTATVVLVLQSRLFVGHVGDSRAYVYDPNNGDEKLRLLTRDHSLVQRLQELGQLTPEEAAVHPQRNVLYRAVGQGEGLEVDVDSEKVPRHGRVLICSDGLWGLVDDDELLAIIESSTTSQQACERMIEAANDAGGNDNITAVMIDFMY